MKKKILLVVAAFLMVFALCACGSASKKVIGNWTIEEITSNDVVVSAEQYKDLMDTDLGTVVFNEDNTCTISIGASDAQVLKWSVDGNTLQIGNEGDSSYIEADVDSSEMTLHDEDETRTIKIKKDK